MIVAAIISAIAVIIAAIINKLPPPDIKVIGGHPTPINLNSNSSLYITITIIPHAGPGGENSPQEPIGGQVGGIVSSDYSNYFVAVYTYAKNGDKNPWTIQPSFADPKTPIGSDGFWKTMARQGSSYMAILRTGSIASSNSPEGTLLVEPPLGGSILAKTNVLGVYHD